MDTIRLFRRFQPTNYDITLDLQREERTFTGKVVLDGTLRDGNAIPLHAKGLTITEAVIDDQPAQVSYHEHDEIRLIVPDLAPGEHTIAITFSGTITDAMHGLYPCYYKVDGQPQELLATQFESHHAREVFPCVDEPEAKATFRLTLITETDTTVLSNTPVQSQQAKDGRLHTTFEQTPRMSSYLLAFVTGDLQVKRATTSSGIDVGVWATKAHPHSYLDFALDAAVRLIEFYRDYFGVPYPLTKCDHVALPDFSSGAMENWGLITYRETALLANPSGPVSSRRYVATVIAHELSHQWFGNLVTMRWWDDLWLNESFANVMEYIAVDALWPQWQVWRDFSSHESVAALRRDALPGVQPVYMPISHPDEINTLFDGAIVYAKGARLMRMMQHAIGESAFRSGLQTYFTEHAYNNTSGNDLWKALSDSSGQDVKALMQAWISSPGFPVVRITEEEGNTLRLSQSRFFNDGDDRGDQTLWPIPLGADRPNLPHMLTTKETTLPSTDPFMLNSGDTAHFITQYPQSWRQLFATAEFIAAKDAITRLQYLHEQILLVKAGLVPAPELVPLIQAIATVESTKRQADPAVWGMISLAISELRRIIEGDEAAEKALKRITWRLVQPLYDQLGWEPQAGEDEDIAELRATIISLALYAEHEPALAKAHELYRAVSLAELNPELRGSILASVIRHNDPDGSIAQTLLQQYQSETDGDIQQDITSALTATKDATTGDMLRHAMQDSTVIRPQDVAFWFVYLLRNRFQRANTWQWLVDNWSWIEDTFGGDKSLDLFPRYAGNCLSTTAELGAYTKFFTPLEDDPALARAIAVGKADITARISQIGRDRAPLVTVILATDAAA